MTRHIEWTGTSVPAEYTATPGTITDGHGSSNDGSALLIHSGDGDGVCVEASDPEALIAWLTRIIQTIRASATHPAPGILPADGTTRRRFTRSYYARVVQTYEVDLPSDIPATEWLNADPVAADEHICDQGRLVDEHLNYTDNDDLTLSPADSKHPAAITDHHLRRTR